MGCGTSLTNVHKVQSYEPINTYSQFIGRVLRHCDIICSNHQYEIRQSSQYLLLSWKQLMKCVDYQNLGEFIPQISNSILKLLEQLEIQIKAKSSIMLDLIQILGYLSRIIFQYYIQNQKRFIRTKEQIMNMLDYIQQLLVSEIDDQMILNFMEYHLFKLRTCILIIPTNSREAQQILINLFAGIIKSVSSFKLSDDLTAGIKQGLIYLYQEYDKNKEKQKYQLIFYLDTIKCKVIEQFDLGIYNLDSVQIIYDTFIKNSKEWEIGCAWSELLNSLLSYKLPADAEQICQLFNQQQMVQFQMQGKLYKRDDDYFINLYQIEIPQKLDKLIKNQIFSNLYLIFQSQLINQGQFSVKQYYKKHLQIQQNVSLQNQIIKQEISTFIINLDKFINNIDKFNVEKQIQDFFYIYQSSKFLQVFKLFKIKPIPKESKLNQVSLQYLSHLVQNCIIESVDEYKDIIDPIVQDDLGSLTQFNQSLVGKEASYKPDLFKKVEQLMNRQTPVQLKSEELFQYGQLLYQLIKFQYQQIIKYQLTNDQEYLINIHKFPYKTLLQSVREIYEQYIQIQPYLTIFYQLTGVINQLTDQYNECIIQLRGYNELDLTCVQDLFEQLKQLQSNIEKQKSEKQNVITLMINQIKIDQQDQIILNLESAQLFFNQDINTIIQDKPQIQKYSKLIDNDKHIQFLLQLSQIDQEITEVVQNIQRQINIQIKKQLTERIAKIQNSCTTKSSINQLQLLQNEMKPQEDQQLDLIIENIIQLNNIDSQIKALEILDQEDKTLSLKYQNKQQSVSQLIRNLKELNILRFDDQFLTSLSTDQFENLQQFTQKPNIDEIQLKLQDIFDHNSWRIRAFLTMQIQMFQSNMLGKNKTTLEDLIVELKFLETDDRIKFDSQNQKLIQETLHNNWEQFEKEFKYQVKQSYDQLLEIQNQISYEQNETIKNQLTSQYNKLYKQINLQLQNIETLADAVGIVLTFLQEIRQDLKKLQDQMNRIEGKVDIIIDLLSNSYKQRLNIIRNRSLSFQIQNFIQIYGQEKIKNKFGQRQLVFDLEVFNKSLYNEFLWKDEQVMLVIGNEGMGKTILSQLIEQQCWKSSKYIPLRIDLSIHNNFNKCLLQQFNENQIQDLKQSNKQYLFIIDGYEHPYDNFIKYYNMSTWNNFKIIYLCREAFIIKHDIDQFTNQGGPIKIIKLSLLTLQQIRDFFTSIVNQQIQKIIKQDINLSYQNFGDIFQFKQIKDIIGILQQKEKEALIKQLKQIHTPQYYINQINNLQLMKLMNTPMMLQFLIQIISILQQKEQTNELNQLLNLKTDQRLLNSQVRKLTNDEFLIGLAQDQPTQMDFYDILLRTQIREKLIEKDQNIYDELIDDIIEFAQNLAYQMTVNDLTSVSLIDQNLVCKQSKDWRDQFFNFQGELGQHKKSYIQLLPAYFDGLRFQYNHKTIQEYLFCLYINKNLDRMGEINISTFNINILIQSINQDQQYQLFEKLSNNVIMNSNIIYILSKSQFDFNGKNLQNLSIKDIDISNTVFTNTDLTNSNFDNVTITGCAFDNCKIQNNQWKINVDILSILRHKDYQQTLTVQFIDKGQQVLQITTRGIIIWDIKQQKVRYEFELDGIEEISVYEDQLVCSGSDFESDFLLQFNLSSFKHSRRELVVKKICLIENNIIVYQNKDMSLKFIQNNEILGYEISFTQAIQKIVSNKIYIAIIYGNNNLRLIKVQTFETYLELKSDWPLNKININQQYVAFSNSVGEITVLNLKSQQQYKLKGHQFVVELIEFLSNDRLISVSLDNTIKVWNIKNQNVQSYEKGLYQSISIYENTMAAASQEGFIFIIDYQQLKPKLDYEQSDITAADIGSDFIIFGHLDGQIQYFDYFNKKYIQAYQGKVSHIVILEKQLQFVTYGDEQLIFWSMITFDKFSIDIKIDSICSINQKDVAIIQNQLIYVIEFEWKDKFQYKMSLYHESNPPQNSIILNANESHDNIISKTQIGENILLFDVQKDIFMKVLTVNTNYEVLLDGQTIQNTQKDINRALIVNLETIALFYQKYIVIHNKEQIQYKTDTQVTQIHIYNNKIFYLDGILKYIQIIGQTSFLQYTDIICEIFTISQNGDIIYQDLDCFIHLVDKNLKTRKQLFNLPIRSIKKLLYAFDYVITLQNKELKLNKQDLTINITQQAEDIYIQGLNLFYLENRLLKCYDLYGKELIFTLHQDVISFKSLYNIDYSFPHLYYILDNQKNLNQFNIEIPNLHTPKFIKSSGDTVISCCINGSIWVWNKGGWRLATLTYQPIVNVIQAAIDTNITAVYELDSKYHIIVWDFNSQEQIYKYINNDKIINITIMDNMICFFQRKYLKDQNFIYLDYDKQTEQEYDLYGIDINQAVWKDSQILILGHQSFSQFRMEKNIALTKNYGMRYKFQYKK